MTYRHRRKTMLGRRIGEGMNNRELREPRIGEITRLGVL